MGITGSIVFSGRDNSVRVLSLPEEAFDGEISGGNARVLEVDQKIHGFYVDNSARDNTYLIVALETADNQLDFNKLSVEGLDDDDSFTFSFTQLRLINPRPI